MALATGTGSDNGIEVKPKDQVDLGESVTSGDIDRAGGFGGGSTVNFWFSPHLGQGVGADMASQLLPALPPWWSRQRDRVMVRSDEYEDLWASTLSIAVTKAAATSFEVEGASDLMAKKGQELFNDHTNGGAGWANFVSPHIQDFLKTDNGAFVEVDRVDNSKPGSKVIGLYHLDSLRCWLTGNPDKPVIYWALNGTFHYLTWWQVFHISDMPSPRNNYFKVGKCATGRAWRAIRRRVAAELYDYQEMTGAVPNKLALIQGLTQQALEGYLQTDKSNREIKQAVINGNLAMMAMMSNSPIDFKTLPIREKPTDWDGEKELEHTSILYAAAVGIDKSDLKPFTGQMAGTATQSEIQHAKEKGKGMALWRNSFEWFMSNYVLPTQASFHWIDLDLGQKKQMADLFSSYMSSVRTAVGPSVPILSQQQGIQVLVDADQLDRQFLPNGEDITPGTTLEDDEKLIDPIAGDNQQQQPPAPEQQKVPSPAAFADMVEKNVLHTYSVFKNVLSPEAFDELIAKQRSALTQPLENVMKEMAEQIVAKEHIEVGDLRVLRYLIELSDRLFEPVKEGAA